MRITERLNDGRVNISFEVFPPKTDDGYEKGITVPVLPGIMPVTNKKQIARIGGMSGTALPERFRAIVDCFGENPKAMQQAGIAYATDQIIDLIANGVKNIHIYSMNKPEVASSIISNLSEIVK